MGRVRVKQRRPWWDRLFLVFVVLLFLPATATLLLLVVDKPRRWLVVGGGCGGYIGTVVFMYFASRRIERRLLEQDIELLRNACCFRESRCTLTVDRSQYHSQMPNRR